MLRLSVCVRAYSRKGDKQKGSEDGQLLRASKRTIIQLPQSQSTITYPDEGPAGTKEFVWSLAVTRKGTTTLKEHFIPMSAQTFDKRHRLYITLKTMSLYETRFKEYYNNIKGLSVKGIFKDKSHCKVLERCS